VSTSFPISLCQYGLLRTVTEELQSTTEELETSNEELQSANEELATLNEELQNRNTQLSEAHNDILNLLGSIDVSVILLDRDLRIRRTTPTAEKVLNILASDIGRPLRDLALEVVIPGLEQSLQQVMKTGTVRNEEIQGSTAAGMRRRSLPTLPQMARPKTSCWY
jgi:two-component system CheB/CheR fusion protein